MSDKTDYKRLWRKAKEENLKLWKENYQLKEALDDKIRNQEVRQEVVGEGQGEGQPPVPDMQSDGEGKLASHRGAEEPNTEVGPGKRDNSVSKAPYVLKRNVGSPNSTKVSRVVSRTIPRKTQASSGK